MIEIVCYVLLSLMIYLSGVLIGVCIAWDRTWVSAGGGCRATTVHPGDATRDPVPATRAGAAAPELKGGR